MKRRYDLEKRLITFAIEIIKLAELLPKDHIGKYFKTQLVRSGSSPALNYGEAQGAESRKDFVHKMGICLKELRETTINLKIIEGRPLTKVEMVTPVLKEATELVAIFAASIKTAKQKK